MHENTEKNEKDSPLTLVRKGSPLRGSFPWTRSGSGPLHLGGFYLG
ncbi:unnamed protein product [Brassica oleracea var. botrytis]